MIETEKETVPSRLLTFEMNERVVRGWYVETGDTLVQVKVYSDSKGIFKEGDHTNIHKHFLQDLEDQEFISQCQYDKLNIIQKWFGKYYIGIPVLAGMLYYVFS